MCITKETKLPQLVAQQSIFNLIVPEKVEEKIRYLIRKFPHTEWSGVLFYKHQGTFEDKDLVITCEDIYPMDLGTSGWTEFKMNEDVTSYMAENIELFDCEMGLVHSHHTMGAFFSSQDNLMLQQEGNDTNCFVSLVVDTRGQYVARITRKVQSKSEVTVKNLGTSYEFFGEGSKEITHNGKEITKEVDKEVIEYFDLAVERHEVSNSLDYLDTRFDEIQKRKEASSPKSMFNNLDSKELKLPWNKEPKELNMFEKYPLDKSKDDISIYDWTPDPKKIHKAVVSMITCSFIVSTEKFDLKQWVAKYLNKVYKRVFGDYKDVNHSLAFSEWKDFIVQFTLDYFDEDPALKDVDMDLYISRIAQALCAELEEFSNNEYVNAYICDLEQYIME